MSALLWGLAFVCWGLAAVLVASLATDADSSVQGQKTRR